LCNANGTNGCNTAVSGIFMVMFGCALDGCLKPTSLSLPSRTDDADLQPNDVINLTVSP
jgi:hypothetical protein